MTIYLFFIYFFQKKKKTKIFPRWLKTGDIETGVGGKGELALFSVIPLPFLITLFRGSPKPLGGGIYPGKTMIPRDQGVGAGSKNACHAFAARGFEGKGLMLFGEGARDGL